MRKVLSIVRTNSPTLVRLVDGFGYISIWATPSNKLTFWNGAQSFEGGLFEHSIVRTNSPTLALDLGMVFENI